ncbi:amino acid ABC transporter permease [Sporolactobacillus shoreicorticis]|uniref:Amino acid ABC transporter permease n=1 Tax=Sporolactobacillus shoreicorticis TaxID=1923877 RepID=A0ABW5S3T8_9BACL|nr:amino acid ABC transporter permease [Sporolactobacillus shoreicorticis]MCO7124304.1 amino acid ABC transporter permease [Sporolactobacillus shoreicorticis]
MGKIFDPVFMIQSFPEILKALPITLFIAFVSAVIGLVIAFIVSFIRYSNIRILSPIAKAYISFIRGTPDLVQIMLVYYGIPLFLKAINEKFGTAFDVNGVPSIAFAIIALAINAGAYMSETMRSSLLAVDSGQLEACYSVNMTRLQALWRVIIPQAIGIAIPPLSNTLISLIKATSLVFTISIIDLMAQAKIVGSRSFRFFEIYVVVSIIYWVICAVVAFALSKVEVHAKRYERKVDQ